MDTVRKVRRGAAAALAITSAALTAGCATGTPASGPATAHPVAVTSSQAAAGTVPPVFAVSFGPAQPGPAQPGRGGNRIGLLSSRTGALLRWLTSSSERTTDQALSVRGGWVYFVRDPIAPEPGQAPRGPASRGPASRGPASRGPTSRGPTSRGQVPRGPASRGPASHRPASREPASPGPAIWRVRVTGGRAQLVQAGASDYAVSPDDRVVAYVTSTDRTVEIVARNLATGRRNTIVLATRPDPRASNWPPEVSGLTWAGDDAHLAVQVQLTAAIGSVLTLGAFTAARISDGRTGPPPCPAATHDQCAESGPGYLASGALSYVIQRLSGSGTVRASLVAWRPGYPATTLLSFPGGPPPQSYAITAQGQAIWASAPAQPKGPWTVWRWSGGTPVKITTLPALGASPYYAVAAIAW
ncbi:MAG TPA: hypothetical protein VFQ68_02975 [Streptosporangiaceae bacterium]|nr:hypothetical protein [Streptosporangiaceae bacterium]